MSRLFTLLCAALLTLAAPACDDPDPKDPAPTDEENSSGSESSSSGHPDDLVPGGEDETSSETGDAPGTASLAPGSGGDGDDGGEDPGTATLATPHISSGETL